MLCIFTRPIYPNIHMHGKGHYFSCSYANKIRRRHNRKLLTKYAFPKKAHSIRFYHTIIKVSSVFGTRAYQEGQITHAKNANSPISTNIMVYFIQLRGVLQNNSNVIIVNILLKVYFRLNETMIPNVYFLTGIMNKTCKKHLYR